MKSSEVKVFSIFGNVGENFSLWRLSTKAWSSLHGQIKELKQQMQRGHKALREELV